MVSWHAEITSSKIVSTTSRVDLIFSQNPGKIWEIRPKRGIQTPSIYFRANSPELSVEEQREAIPIAQFWTISVGLDSFPVKGISICCNFISRFYCIFASSVNQPIARCCNFTSAEEPAIPKRSSSASDAFKLLGLYLNSCLHLRSNVPVLALDKVHLRWGIQKFRSVAFSHPHSYWHRASDTPADRFRCTYHPYWPVFFALLHFHILERKPFIRV